MINTMALMFWLASCPDPLRCQPIISETDYETCTVNAAIASRWLRITGITNRSYQHFDGDPVVAVACLPMPLDPCEEARS